MRRLTLLTLLLSAATLGAWDLPPPLETGHLLGKGLAAGTPPVPLQDELYALGWSRANALAVLEHRRGGGIHDARFRVLDLVEDRVLFEAVWPGWEEGGRETWWESHRDEAVSVFSRFGLTPTTWQLGVFPLILDNEYYTVALRPQFSRRDPGWIDRLDLLVHSTGRGLKTVASLPGYWRWAALLGFLPSPYENRLALVLVVQPSGWEGSEPPLRFLVVGLSLKAGFPPP